VAMSARFNASYGGPRGPPCSQSGTELPFASATGSRSAAVALEPARPWTEPDPSCVTVSSGSQTSAGRHNVGEAGAGPDAVPGRPAGPPRTGPSGGTPRHPHRRIIQPPVGVRHSSAPIPTTRSMMSSRTPPLSAGAGHGHGVSPRRTRWRSPPASDQVNHVVDAGHAPRCTAGRSARTAHTAVSENAARSQVPQGDRLVNRR